MDRMLGSRVYAAGKAKEICRGHGPRYWSLVPCWAGGVDLFKLEWVAGSWGKPMQSEDKLGRAVGVGICLDERPADWVAGVHKGKKKKKHRNKHGDTAERRG